MIDNFPTAESMRKIVKNQIEYEVKEAEKVLPEILNQMIKLKAEDLCNSVSIPALPCSSIESATLIKEFYTNFYFSLHYLNYEEELGKVNAGLIGYEIFQKQLEEASKYYYLRYLFENKNILTTMLKLLKQQGFKTKVDKETGGEGSDDKLSFVISWIENS